MISLVLTAVLSMPLPYGAGYYEPCTVCRATGWLTWEDEEGLTEWWPSSCHTCEGHGRLWVKPMRTWLADPRWSK